MYCTVFIINVRIRYTISEEEEVIIKWKINIH